MSKECENCKGKNQKKNEDGTVCLTCASCRHSKERIIKEIDKNKRNKESSLILFPKTKRNHNLVSLFLLPFYN